MEDKGTHSPDFAMTGQSGHWEKWSDKAIRY